MSVVTVVGEPGNWVVTIGKGVYAATYRDLTPGRDLEEATKRATAVSNRRKKSGGSAYTNNVFLFGEKGLARARSMGIGGLFGEDVAAVERALNGAWRDER